MRHKDKKELIKKIIKKKKEYPIVEIHIANYNNTNFYLALVYSSSIEKFKVLYIPMDIIDTNKVEEYFCYQFININSVTYIADQVKAKLSKYEKKETRDKRNKNIDNFKIDLDIHIDKKTYDFHMTRYLPKEWKFLFETMALMFEHVPNIMGELAMEILSVVMNTNDLIEYQASLNCDLWENNLIEFFPVLKDEKKLIEGNLSFLESVNGKYYAIIENHLLIIEYNDHAKILNIFCDDKNLVYSSYTYQVLKAIKNNIEKAFLKVKVLEKEEKYNYLCLGVDKKRLQVIKDNIITSIPLSNKSRKEIIILEDKENKLQKELDKVML